MLTNPRRSVNLKALAHYNDKLSALLGQALEEKIQAVEELPAAQEDGVLYIVKGQSFHLNGESVYAASGGGGGGAVLSSVNDYSELAAVGTPFAWCENAYTLEEWGPLETEPTVVSFDSSDLGSVSAMDEPVEIRPLKTLPELDIPSYILDDAEAMSKCFLIAMNEDGGQMMAGLSQNSEPEWVFMYAFADANDEVSSLFFYAWKPIDFLGQFPVPEAGWYEFDTASGVLSAVDGEMPSFHAVKLVVAEGAPDGFFANFFEQFGREYPAGLYAKPGATWEHIGPTKLPKIPAIPEIPFSRTKEITLESNTHYGIFRNVKYHAVWSDAETNYVGFSFEGSGNFWITVEPSSAPRQVYISWKHESNKGLAVQRRKGTRMLNQGIRAGKSGQRNQIYGSWVRASPITACSCARRVTRRFAMRRTIERRVWRCKEQATPQTRATPST
jgi:hypothetical protein